MIHNSVNSRLKAEEELSKSEDFYVMKQQLPSINECPNCHKNGKIN